MVEGRVLSVRESGGTIYVNFGRRWSEDFTVTVAKRNERAMNAGAVDLRQLEKRMVRVRGFIEERGGPWLDVTRPGADRTGTERDAVTVAVQEPHRKRRGAAFAAACALALTAGGLHDAAWRDHDLDLAARSAAAGGARRAGRARASAHSGGLWRRLSEPAAAGAAAADGREAGRGLRPAGSALPRHHPEFAGRQRLRAAERQPLCDARAARARQRYRRTCLGAQPRDGARDRAARGVARGPGEAGRRSSTGSRPTC